MTAAAPGEFEEFWHQQYAPLVRWLARSGAGSEDAQDIAQAALTEIWRRWPMVVNRPGYLYRAARNELAGLWHARRRELGAARGSDWPAAQQAGDDLPAVLQAGLVREYLLTLPSRQRAVLAAGCDGYQDAELAAALGMPVATVRSNRRHARKGLLGYTAALEQDPRGLMLHRAYEEMRGGNSSPPGSRPVICQSWARSAQYLAVPERDPLIAPLSGDELALRRTLSPLRACRAVWDKIADATGLMIVVTDADGRVLWRAGDRKDLRRGDRDGHIEGACVAEHSIGTCGISVALAASHPVMVRGPEHYCPALHDLACASAPVRHPEDGRLLGALSLTAPWPAAHPDMLKAIDQAARQVQRQIASTASDHHPRSP